MQLLKVAISPSFCQRAEYTHKAFAIGAQRTPSGLVVSTNAERRVKALQVEKPAAPKMSGTRPEANNEPDNLGRAPLLERDASIPPPSNYGWQYLVVMCTISIVICYADRSNISTAILPMSEEYGWDKGYQGLVLSAFFLGYATTQILGGSLADRFGSKLVLASGVSLWSLFTFLTPAAAASSFFLLPVRVALGLGEGVAFPAIHSLIATAVPRARQSSAVGLVTAASYLGTAIAFGVSPLIITRSGWPAVFHLFAAMAVLWLPPWLLLNFDAAQPAQSRLPSAATATAAARPAPATGGSLDGPLLLPPDASGRSQAGPVTASIVADGNGGDDGDRNYTAQLCVSPAGCDPGEAVGLWPLLQCKEVWAICAAQYGQSWGMYGLLTWLPTFFHDTYNVDTGDMGSYTLLPYVVQGVVGLAAGVAADKLIAAKFGVRPVRVAFQTAGMLGPAACLLLAVAAAGGVASRASAIVCVALGLSALTLGGVSASHLDIAPRHAGAVYGAGNTAATLAGLISVPTTGWVLQATGSWPLVFAIISLHYCAGAAVWALWAGATPLAADGGLRTDQAQGTE